MVNSDAFAGQGQVLGMGVDHDGVFVVGEHLRVAETVVNDAAVRFVADDEYLRAVFLLLSAQQFAKGPQAFGGIDDPRGVVGRVDDYRPGLGCDRGFDGGHVRLKFLAGGHYHWNAGVVVHVIAVFDKVWGKENDLFPGIEDGL